MKRLRILAILLSTFIFMAFQLPKNIHKKVSKEVTSSYGVESFSLEAIKVSDEVNKSLKQKITGDNLFKIINDQDQLLGYAFVDTASSKTDYFNYLVLFDKDFIIKKSKVLIYREDYGGEISSKRWLRQFEGKSVSDKLTYGSDIVAISGATISANSMTVAVNNVLETINYLQENKLF